MIFKKKKIWYIKIISKSISLKMQDKLLANVFYILECLLSQNPTIQGSQLSWFFQIIWKTIRKSKNRASREWFLPESDLKTSTIVSFPKEHSHFGGLETNQRHETQTRCVFFHVPLNIWTNVIKKLVWTEFLQFFELYIFRSVNPIKVIFTRLTVGY